MERETFVGQFVTKLIETGPTGGNPVMQLCVMKFVKNKLKYFVTWLQCRMLMLSPLMSAWMIVLPSLRLVLVRIFVLSGCSNRPPLAAWVCMSRSKQVSCLRLVA
eukprot:4658311-Pyramimonas_sp.AAC.1